MEQSQSQDFLLADDLTLEQRWQALCLNVQTWYERLARAACELARQQTCRHIVLNATAMGIAYRSQTSPMLTHGTFLVQ